MADFYCCCREAEPVIDPEEAAFGLSLVDGARSNVSGGVEADDFLLHHRLGRDGAESTRQSYAASLALFFDWSASIRKPWREFAAISP